MTAVFFYLITHASLLQCAQTKDAVSTAGSHFLEQVIGSHSSSVGGVPDAVAMTGQLFVLQISPHAFGGNVTTLEVGLST